MGYSGKNAVERAAQGILSIATVIMGGAIKRITIERGRDPRDFTLVAYGGGGPLHAVELARELNIPSVIIPPEPGNYSAMGMLLSDIQRESSITFRKIVSADSFGQIEEKFLEMERQSKEEMLKDVGDSPITIHRVAEMRYKGQEHTVTTKLTGIRTPELLREEFEKTYSIRFGRANKTNPIEIVNLRLVVTADIQNPDFECFRVKEGDGNALREYREVCLPGSTETESVAIYDRKRMNSGFSANGPCIIEEYGSTTLINRHDRFEVGEMGELRIYLDCI